MPLTCDPQDTFTVELGGRAVVFKHLTARQAKRWRAELERYLAPDRPLTDAEAADAAASLLQPYVADGADLLDALPESLLVLLPMAFESARQASERELGESCWRRIFGPAPVATTAATGDAPTSQTGSGPCNSTT